MLSHDKCVWMAPDLFVEETRGLSNAQIGLYWHTIMLCGKHNGPVTAKALKRSCPEGGKKIAAHINQLVLAGKLTRSEGPRGKGSWLAPSPCESIRYAEGEPQ